MLPPAGQGFQKVIQKQIAQGRREESLRRHEPFRGHHLPHPGQLEHGYQGEQRAVLDQDDRLSQQRRDRRPDGLGQDDIPHPLKKIEAEGGFNWSKDRKLPTFWDDEIKRR